MKKYSILKLITAFASLMVISYSCDKEVSTSPPIDPVPLGFLYVNSEPAGAKIYENGLNTGLVTPDSLPWLELKQYDITLKMNLFRDTTFRVEIAEFEKKKIFIEYLANPKMLGEINCNTNPDGAVIIFEDTLTQFLTPHRFKKIPPGEYQVSYQLANHREKTIRVTVSSNKVSDAVTALRDTSVWVDYSTSTSILPDNYIYSVAVSSDNTKWIGTNGFGLVSFDDREWKIYNTFNSPLPSDRITCLVADDKENIWIGTDNGLAKFDKFTWSVYLANESFLVSDNITTLAFNPLSGNIWIGSLDGGLIRTNGADDWKLFNNVKSSLEENWVTTMSIDGRGVKYFGSNTNGITTFDDQEWKTFRNNVDGTFPWGAPGYNLIPLPSNFVKASAVTPLGSIIFGHLETKSGLGGTSSFNGRRWYYNIIHLPSNRIEKIFIDPSGIRWVATADGLVRSSTSSGTKTLVTSNSGLTSNHIKDVVMDQKKIMWIGTFGGGLIKYKGEIGN